MSNVIVGAIIAGCWVFFGGFVIGSLTESRRARRAMRKATAAYTDEKRAS